MVTGALMRRNLFLKVASILWLVGIAISQINHYLSGALIGLGILALAIGFAEALAEDRGIQLFGKKGTRYGIALFAIGGALLVGGGLGPALGVAQLTVDLIQAIGATIVGLSLLALYLAFLDSTESTGRN